MKRNTFPLFLNITSLFITYVITAKLGLMLDAVSGFATLVWPPSGIALVSIVLLGKRVWPGIFFGALVVNFWAGAPLPVALGIALGNTGEALLGAYLLEIFDFQNGLRRASDVIKLFVLAALCSTLFSASLGVASLILGHLVTLYQFKQTWIAWWVGDAMGILVISPLFFAAANKVLDFRNRWRILEAITLFVSLTCLVLFLFGRIPTDPLISHFPRTYFVFPFLLWAAIRFYQPGAAVATLLVSVIGIWETYFGLGPFSSASSLSERLISLQFFITVVSLTGLLVGSVVSQRQQAFAEAQEAIRARNDFLSIASHELRTPLTSLQLQLQMLIKAIKTPQLKGMPSHEKILTSIDKSNNQAKRIANLVDDLLDVTRIEAGKLGLDIGEVCLHELIEEIVQRYSEQLTIAGCTAHLDVDNHLIGSWDKMRMEQVIINLITNAIKYAPGEKIEITAKHRGSRILLVFKDSGPGIKKEDQERIFRRFERVDSPKAIMGLGLGLFIVKKIVEAHRGEIRVESELGKGTSFIIDLPLNAEEVGAREGHEPTAAT